MSAQCKHKVIVFSKVVMIKYQMHQHVTMHHQNNIEKLSLSARVTSVNSQQGVSTTDILTLGSIEISFQSQRQFKKSRYREAVMPVYINLDLQQEDISGLQHYQLI